MKLMVLDGNSILNRAFYGIRPLTNQQGLYTHAVYGFLMTMLRLLEEEQPQALCVTFDRREPTFRRQADPDYKAQRKGMPEELAVQLPVIKQVLEQMNIPCYEKAGFEADDLIGTISRRCEAEGWDCVVATGDKDSLQLVTEHTTVKLVTTRMGQTTTRQMTPERFREEYGFDPIHMIDLKALMGDTSDNIPGVPGVGEKTAMELIRRYGSIGYLYQHLPELEVKPAVLRKLSEGEKSAYHSYWLATIVTNVPMDFAPEDNLRREPQPELYELFRQLEFQKLIEKFGLKPVQPRVEKREVQGTCTVRELCRQEEVEQAVERMKALGQTAYLRAPGPDAIAVQPEEEGSDAVGYLLRRDSFQEDYVLALKTLFAPELPKAGHQIKELQRELLSYGIAPEGWVFDSALAAYLLDATAGNYDLYWLCEKYCGFTPYRSAQPEGEQLSLLEQPPELTRAQENAELLSAAAAVACLEEVLRPKLQELQMEELYQKAELPLSGVLARMEHTGIRIDAQALRRYGEGLEQQIKTLEQEIYTLAGTKFNLNSPKQLGEVLFDKLQLPHGKKTGKGYSTSIDVLEKLRYQYPIVEQVLRYRQFSKLKSTYADGLGKVVEPDGRIHTRFQMTVTATGRLSSAEPNLQNIPTRTELGSELRRMFIARPGWVLVDADYSQIELRLLAHVAGDTAMQQAFCAGEDIHTVTASQVFGVPPEQVTRQMRSHAKAVNFGIVYGISAFSLAQDIGVSVAEAKAYIEHYLGRFQGIRAYMEDAVAKARETGYAETIFHRRRSLPELTASNFATRSFGERVALNMPIQGAAADLMKMAMVRVDQRLRREQRQGRLVLQVHDELLVECPAEEAEQVAAILTEEMEQVAALSVPLIAEAHIGDNWLDAK